MGGEFGGWFEGGILFTAVPEASGFDGEEVRGPRMVFPNLKTFGQFGLDWNTDPRRPNVPLWTTHRIAARVPIGSYRRQARPRYVPRLLVATQILPLVALFPPQPFMPSYQPPWTGSRRGVHNCAEPWHGVDRIR